MKKFVKFAAAAGLLASAAVTNVQAAPVTVLDTYWGGNDGSVNADVVGATSVFDIASMVVDRVGNNLKVVINTNYANHVGNLGTRLGALFLGDPTKLNFNTAGGTTAPGAAGSPKYGSDVFTADKDRFGYAFDFDTTNPGNLSVKTGTGSLWDLREDGTDVVLSSASGGFRSGQAVDVNHAKATDTGVDGTWSITTNSSGPGQISFNITNFFSLSTLPAIYKTSMTLAWAMSCSNDIILASVRVPKDSTPGVPVPAGAVLLLSGLAGLGAMGRMRKAKA